jgi:hypothetical protein
MTQQLFGYISGFLILLSFVPYLRDIFKGTTKPERASWLIWSVLNMIAFFSQLAKGASDSLWLTGGQVVGDIAVFLLSIKYGMGGYAKKDLIALTAASTGLILWYITNEAAIALFIAIMIDAAGLYLTVEKAYEKPFTETLSSWVLTLLAGFFAFFSVDALNFTLLAWPMYIFIAGAAVTTAMILGKRRSEHGL